MRKGLAMPAPELPLTWKSGGSNPSSLELALEVAARSAGMECHEHVHSEMETPTLNATAGKQNLSGEPKINATFPIDGGHRGLPPQKENSSPVPKLLQQDLVDSPLQSPRSKLPGDDDCDIDDREVLRGLHIAISAACDEQVDRWIRQETGVRIRRFLADLKAFEMLGEDGKSRSGPQEERARTRRAQLRKLKAETRKSRTQMEKNEAGKEL